MNYEFPTINNISDVLPAIEGRDEFTVAVKEGYTVINYNVMMADTFDCNIRRECRGIIFDTATGEIIRRPFHKFFNVNEREETQDHVVDLSQSHAILEKLDGSMIAPFIVNGQMIWGTKMGATDVAKPVEAFVEAHSEYRIYAKFMLSRGYTPIFEWCSRKQRIVLDYSEDQLILTAVRDLVSGRYVSRDLMMINAENYNIPVVRTWDVGLEMDNKTMKSFIGYVRDLEDREGFVVRFSDGHMIKLKCDWYVQIHKAKEAILQDRNIVELILDEKLDDVKAHLTQEDRDRLTQFENDFNAALHRQIKAITMIVDTLVFNKNQISRKDFALSTMSSNMHSHTRPIVFKNFEGATQEKIEADVRNTIRNNLTKTVKYEAIRDAWFPGVKYNAT
jgi:T4 RnlA family RNA ligase